MKKKKKKTKTRGSRRSKGTKSSTKRRGTGKRTTFSKLWRRIGNAVLRAAEQGHGCDRKAVITKLSGDADLQRLIVERTVRLLSATAERAACSSSIPLLDTTPRQEDPMADEYVLASRSSEVCCGNDGADVTSEEEKADWRVL
jgi:hypothetical protein